LHSLSTLAIRTLSCPIQKKKQRSGAYRVRLVDGARSRETLYFLQNMNKNGL
jgi:hypothetical protein